MIDTNEIVQRHHDEFKALNELLESVPLSYDNTMRFEALARAFMRYHYMEWRNLADDDLDAVIG